MEVAEMIDGVILTNRTPEEIQAAIEEDIRLSDLLTEWPNVDDDVPTKNTRKKQRTKPCKKRTAGGKNSL
jgi:hypothetical protein